MSTLTRRDVAFRSLALAYQPVRYEYLDPAAAREIEALAAQIIPSDGTPGAREAGVIRFIDHVLATWDSDKREIYRRGLEAAQQKRGELFPQSASVTALDDAQARQLVAAIEKTEFFEVLRTHTLLGFFGAHGGAGWAYLGVQNRMMFQPPFGHYDAEAAKEDGK